MKLEALIVCKSPDRYMPLATKLLRGGLVRVYVRRENEYRVFSLIEPDQVENGGSLISKLPADLPATFLHTGDRELFDGHKLKSMVTFVFNAPGTPHTLPKEIPIYRMTFPSFEVTETDIQQIIAYIKGDRVELPDCCQQTKKRELLGSLAILCQGFLAVHANPETGFPDFEETSDDYEACGAALKLMGWSQFLLQKGLMLKKSGIYDAEKRQQLQRIVCEPSWWAVVKRENWLRDLQEEWGAVNDEDWPYIQALTKSIDDGDNGAPPLEIEVGHVVKAYHAIFRKLGGRYD